MVDLSRALLQRHRRIMRRTVAGVVLAACVLVYAQVQQALDAEKANLAERARDRAAALEATLHGSSDGVKAMQGVAHLLYRTLPEAAAPSPLLRALLASAVDSAANLDSPPPPWTTADIGNLTGDVGAPDASLARELEMVLSLNSIFMAIEASGSSVVSVHYTSERDFTSVFPWRPSQHVRFSPALKSREYFVRGRPEANPGRTPYWTDAYRDDAGAATMVTVAAPISEGDVFRGTVALDIGLDELNGFVRDWRSALGELVLANASGQVLAHSSVALSGDRPVPTLGDVLPAGFRADAEAALARAAARPSFRHSHYVAVFALENAPFRLFLVVPWTGLVAAALQDGLATIAVLAAGLGLTLLVATRVVRREFVGPAQRLVRFIEDQGAGPAAAAPAIHPAWRPWFEKVRQVFEAHAQLVAMRQELDVARRVQEYILPAHLPDRPGLRIAARMIPAKEIGGDFYDCFWLDERRIGLVVGDASGKGMPAALFVAAARTALRAAAPSASGPDRCLETANELLSQGNDTAMFVTMFYGVLDTETGEVVYANGGHNPPCVIAPDGTVSELPGMEGMALGVMAGMEYGLGSASLAAGSTLVLYTDGVTEAFDPAGGAFTEARLVATLAGRQDATAEALVASVLEAVETFVDGAPQADDITCLAARFEPPVGDADAGPAGGSA